MPSFDILAESERNKVHITAIKAIEIKASAGQSLVKIETDAGLCGIGEAGASGPMVRAQIRLLEDYFKGADPLEIEKHYEWMTNRMHAYRASVPTISGIDIALWDLAGKILNRPVSKLLSGRFRDEVPLYINTGPANAFDKASCREWADELKKQGWHTVKVGFGPVKPSSRKEFLIGRYARMIGQAEIHAIGTMFENVREGLGWDMDFIIHCHNEWDLPSTLGLAQIVEPSRPLWIEDPLPVPYSDTWKALTQASPVRILTGEKLELSREFLPFLVNQAVSVIQPDIAFAGGFTGCKKIADLAELFYIPMTMHNVGTLVQNAATAHFGASTRNFVMTETRISQYKLIHEMGTEDLQVKDGCLKVPDGPGLGIELNEDVLRANLADGEEYWD